MAPQRELNDTDPQALRWRYEQRVQQARAARSLSLEQALDLWQQARDIAQTLGDADCISYCLLELAQIANDLGDNAKSMQWAEQVIELGHPEHCVQAYLLKGYIHMRHSSAAQALSMLLRAKSLIDAKQLASFLGLYYHREGMIFHNVGDYQRARDAYWRAIDHLKEDACEPRATLLANIASCYWSTRDYEKAVGIARRALAVSETCPDLVQLIDPAKNAFIWMTAALAFVEVHDLEQAWRYAQQAQDATQHDSANVYMRMLGAFVVGHVLSRLGRHDEAEESLQAALAATDQQGFSGAAIVIHRSLAELYKGQERYREALEQYEAYNALYEILQKQEYQTAIEIRMQEAREADRRQFERLTQLKDEVLQATTHDLKSPLTVFGVYLTLLAKSVAPLDAQVKGYLDEMQRTVHSMNQLVIDILDLATLEAGHLDTQPVDLSELLDYLSAESRLLAMQQEIDFDEQRQDQQALLMADPIQLERAFRNLLSNALKFTPSGGTIHISTELEGDSLLIHISDSGIGIPEEALPRLFDRFYRAPGAASIGAGSGLGLAITKAIIEQHGGQISVESVVDQGSVFSVRLPLVTEKQSASA
ncbi:MAG: tetratricopeptide repeat protein [Chloroflexi bacterium]|nr:tetratricopeptide repeat protein [Chloroflexota bacterium]